MKLSDLRVFLAVASTGGITNAAAVLHRVPSSVTTCIQKLEADLDVTLFIREGKRLQLSGHGKLLLGYAERLLALAEETKAAMHNTVPSGILALGAMESTAAIRLPALLGKLNEKYPKLSVSLRTGAPRPLTVRVLNGELDAALVAEPVSDPRLKSTLAYTEPLVIIGPRAHPKIRMPKDVQTSTLLVFEPDCPHRQRLEAWCASGNVAPLKILELGSYHAILGCCVAGMGIALIPAAVLATYTERARLSEHYPKGTIASVNTMLISRKDATQPKVNALTQLLLEQQ